MKNDATVHGRFLPMVPADSTERRAELPPMTGQWLLQAAEAEFIPEELEATCAMCPMTSVPFRQGGFKVSTKCCTYWPSLPNFSVGSILADNESANHGRHSVRERIRFRVGVSPLGIAPPQVYLELYRLGARTSFGKSEALSCPYFTEGSCGIWKYRQAVCATWYCRHNRGMVGQTFWNAAQAFLEIAERSVALWAVRQLGIGTDVLASLKSRSTLHSQELSTADLDGRVDSERYKRTWGRWDGREEELYLETSKLVRQLSWHEIVQLGGAELAAHIEIVRHAYAALVERRLPHAARLSDCKVSPNDDEKSFRITAAYERGVVEIPDWALGSLNQFDGRPIAEAVGAIAARTGGTLSEDFVIKLIDHGVLIPCDSRGGITHASREVSTDDGPR